MTDIKTPYRSMTLILKNVKRFDIFISLPAPKMRVYAKY